MDRVNKIDNFEYISDSEYFCCDGKKRDIFQKLELFTMERRKGVVVSQ
ncbi:hypothetical protein [Deferribacter autotrophicus]|nr:hypothetical protein [Deferribacter autotrophicus]